MIFLLYKNMSANRTDVAQYHTFTDEQKNDWWIKEHGKLYADVDLYMREKMNQTSINVDLYLNANDDEKEQLWHIYDSFSRVYCNADKWRNELIKQRKIERYIQQQYPHSHISISIKSSLIEN